MIDEAFYYLSDILSGIDTDHFFVENEVQGIKSNIEEITMETPVELDIINDGGVHIGLVSPLYRLEVTQMPVFHQCKITFQRNP
ncbi:MAG: hypothetical protein KG003_02135 [Bacteroidetes bacterium]|nr:hypothetical protein [Bacteroidota bacterium]